MNSGMERDKRGYMRHNVLIAPIGCSKCEREDININVCDISGSGIGIFTDEKLISGERLELEITIPGDDIPMFVIGEVAWVRRHPDVDSLYNAGIKLTRIHHCDKERLIRYIDSNFVRLE